MLFRVLFIASNPKIRNSSGRDQNFDCWLNSIWKQSHFVTGPVLILDLNCLITQDVMQNHLTPPPRTFSYDIYHSSLPTEGSLRYWGSVTYEWGADGIKGCVCWASCCRPHILGLQI
jgi:hypothetical protein